jgi:hypothetical protein
MHFENGRKAEIGVCAPMGTTLKVMVQDKIQVMLLTYFGNFWIEPRD